MKIIFLASLSFLLTGCASPTASTVQVRDAEISIDLARTVEEQARGLGGRSNLDDRGMLFIYASGKTPTFWMKNMLVPIDLIWINDGKVIGFEKNMTPDSGAKLYQAPGVVTEILEAPAGWLDTHGIVTGDQVVVNLRR
ncbi:DUF192 domain-containing protein [Candidatus Berkelbacteria bacterium]|nr:DUF192 domain-containing protein [Candidatus Berkelbacteria bacterium]